MENSPFDSEPIDVQKGTIAGVVAGVVGAWLWASFAVSEGGEIGFMAWALGGVIAIAAVIGAGGTDPTIGKAAAAISVGAVLLAHFLILHGIAKNMGLESEAFGAAQGVFFSSLDGYDFLWTALASLTAHKIGKSGIEF